MMNRRALITAAAIFPATAATAFVAPVRDPEPADLPDWWKRKLTGHTDPHVEWLKQWRQARAEWCAAADADPNGEWDTPKCKAAMDREYEIRNLLAETEVRTPAGAIAVLAWVLEEAAGEFALEGHEGALRGALPALEGEMV